MKNILFGCLAITLIFLQGCKPKRSLIHQKLSVDISLMDSIKKAADTTYARRYPRTDITVAEYYINRKDSSSTQFLKDSLDNIRQIIIVKNGVRIYTAKFYPNGQLMMQYNFNKTGQYEGDSKEYFENGYLQREGIYKNGFKFGIWKNYDSVGNILSTNKYNIDGQQVN